MINQRRNIDWFLDFLYIDFNNLEIAQRMKWVVETLTMLNYGSPAIMEEPDRSNLISADRWPNGDLYSRIESWGDGEKLAACHEKFNTFFKQMSKQIDDAKSSADKWHSARKLKNFYDFAEEKRTLTIRLVTPVIDRLEFKEGEGSDSLRYRIKEGAFEEAPFRFSITGENDADTLILYFLKALDGFPIKSLRQCPECGRWFFHTTKREKIYCSNKCAARKASRDMRQRINADEKLRKEYLEGGRERAKRAHKRKAKSEKI